MEHGKRRLARNYRQSSEAYIESSVESNGIARFALLLLSNSVTGLNAGSRWTLALRPFDDRNIA